MRATPSCHPFNRNQRACAGFVTDNNTTDTSPDSLGRPPRRIHGSGGGHGAVEPNELPVTAPCNPGVHTGRFIPETRHPDPHFLLKINLYISVTYIVLEETDRDERLIGLSPG